MAMMAVMNLNPIDSNLHFKLIFSSRLLAIVCTLTRVENQTEENSHMIEISMRITV